MIKEYFQIVIGSLITALIKPQIWGIEELGNSTASSLVETASALVFDYLDTNKCLCNKKQGVCDLYCCCDNNCHQERIKEWESAGQCSSANFIPTIEKFYCSNVLGRGQSYLGAPVQRIPLEKLFCIETDNRGKTQEIYNSEAYKSQISGLLAKPINLLQLVDYGFRFGSSRVLQTATGQYNSGDYLKLENPAMTSTTFGQFCDYTAKVEYLADKNLECTLRVVTKDCSIDSTDTLKGFNKFSTQFALNRLRKSMPGIPVSAVFIFSNSDGSKGSSTDEAAYASQATLMGNVCAVTNYLRHIRYIINVDDRRVKTIQLLVYVTNFSVTLVNDYFEYNRGHKTGIKFLWGFTGDLMSLSYSLSPPGYAYGERIVSGLNSTTEIKRYLDDEFSYSNCVDGSIAYGRIKFGWSNSIICTIAITSSATCAEIANQLYTASAKEFLKDSVNQNKLFGRFSNANPEIAKDWVSVTNYTSPDFTPPTENATSTSCDLPTEVSFLMYSSYGLSTAEPKRYLQGMSNRVYKSSIKKNEASTVTLKVSFDWVEVQPLALSSPTSSLTSTATLWTTINGYFSTVLLPLLRKTESKDTGDL